MWQFEFLVDLRHSDNFNCCYSNIINLTEPSCISCSCLTLSRGSCQSACSGSSWTQNSSIPCPFSFWTTSPPTRRSTCGTGSGSWNRGISSKMAGGCSLGGLYPVLKAIRGQCPRLRLSFMFWGIRGIWRRNFCRYRWWCSAGQLAKSWCWIFIRSRWTVYRSGRKAYFPQ